MTRDELVKLSGGEIVGGNVVKGHTCYGRMTEGVFVLTAEGEALIAEAATEDKPAKKPRAKKAEADAADPADELGIDLE